METNSKSTRTFSYGTIAILILLEMVSTVNMYHINGCAQNDVECLILLKAMFGTTAAPSSTTTSSTTTPTTTVQSTNSTSTTESSTMNIKTNDTQRVNLTEVLLRRPPPPALDELPVEDDESRAAELEAILAQFEEERESVGEDTTVDAENATFAIGNDTGNPTEMSTSISEASSPSLNGSNSCQSGVNFSPNGTAPCRECTKCPQGAVPIRECNETHDTMCSCEKKGHYLLTTEYGSECRQCSECPHGYGIWRQCGRTRNTVCRKCPPGTFSGAATGTLGCILCTSCRPDQVMLQECNRVQDTVCVERNLNQRFLESLPRFNAHNRNSMGSNFVGVVDEAHRGHMGSALPVYFTVLSLVIILLFLYVIIQCRMKNTVKRPLPMTSGVLPITTTTTATTRPFIGGAELRLPCDSLSSSQTSGSSTYYTPLARNITLTANKSIQNHNQNHRHSHRHRYNQLSGSSPAKWPRIPGGANIAIANNSFRSQKNHCSQIYSPHRKYQHS